MNIYAIIERIKVITDEIESVEGEFQVVKERYTHLDARRRDLYSERMKIIQELSELCKREY